MTHHHLYAVGNALVDCEYDVANAHVAGQPARRNGGGSAGNTVAALARLGGKAVKPAAALLR